MAFKRDVYKIQILSFDDTFIAEAETPRLTSVGYNYDRFATTLVDTAILAIEGKNPPKMQLLSLIHILCVTTWRKR